MSDVSVRDLLARPNPLTRAVAAILIEHAEEDDCVDYKQTLNLDSEKEWLELVKDISAFANTFGGYLVFGVDDASRQVVGVTHQVAVALKDADQIQQKINRHLEPPVLNLRSKAFRFDDKRVVVLCVAQSRGRTHVVSKDGHFAYPSGDKRQVLSKGTLYVRRVAGNHLADSRDLDDLLERRIDQFRDALLDKVAQVVQAPVESQVFVLAQDDVHAQRFIIENSPDAIPVKGLSFTVSPDGPEQEVAAWSAMCPDRPDSPPPPATLWEWYSVRSGLNLSENHRLAVFRFSLWSDAPAFYWIRGVNREAILESLLLVARYPRDPMAASAAVRVSKFLGQGAHTRVLAALGKYAARLNDESRLFFVPQMDNVLSGLFRRDKDGDLNRALLKLNAIADEAASKHAAPGVQMRWEACELDQFLYAQMDRYKQPSV